MSLRGHGCAEGRRYAGCCLILLVLALGCAHRSPGQVTPADPLGATPRETHEDLHAILWVQTSAEYRALTTAIYARAARVLDLALQDPAWTAAAEQAGSYQSLPPAVILDLDETVFDNSAFQGQLVRDRQSYTEGAWREWVRERKAGAVPGAVAFIQRAEQRGVRVFFVSNRATADEDSTIANLHALGVETTGDALLSPGENGWTSDKTARRAAVAERHRVLLLVGDDLGDFVAVSQLSLHERAAIVARYGDRWLERWVLLPNPSYGSWSRALTSGLTGDSEVLRRKLESVRGYR